MQILLKIKQYFSKLLKMVLKLSQISDRKEPCIGSLLVFNKRPSFFYKCKVKESTILKINRLK